MADTQPNLGYGKQSEATIDQVNIWMRGQPWYQEQMRAWGQDPGHPNTTKEQSRQILHMAQAHGITVDEGDMEVDNHGNFNPKGHKLRNTLIVAGAVGAAIAAPYLYGALAGGGGGAAGASGAAAAGGSGAATGGAAAAGTGLSLGAVEGGAAGLSSSALAGLGTGAMGATPLVGTGVGVLPSLATTATSGSMPAGSTGLAGKAGGSGILSKLTSPETLSGVADTLGGAAKTSLAQNNNADLMNAANERTRLERDKFALTAPGTRLRDSTLASLGSNWQPTKVDWGPGGFHPGAGVEGKIPSFTGGLSGGMQNLDPRTKQLQSTVMDDELQSQLSGGSTGGGKDTYMPPPVTQPSTGDKILGGGATTASILAALAKSGLLSKLVGG